jgi:ABC-type sugar transport system permease subunit
MADAMSVILFAISLIVTMTQLALVGRSARAAA